MDDSGGGIPVLAEPPRTPMGQREIINADPWLSSHRKRNDTRQSGCQQSCLPASRARPAPVQGWQGAAGELPDRAERNTWEQLLVFYPRIEGSSTTTALANCYQCQLHCPALGHPPQYPHLVPSLCWELGLRVQNLEEATGERAVLGPQSRGARGLLQGSEKVTSLNFLSPQARVPL